MTLHSDHHNPLRTQAHLPYSNPSFLKTLLNSVFNHHLLPSSCRSPEPPTHHSTQYSDRFELLSAYLDNEISPEDRRLVNFWLVEDPEIQQVYQHLLRLRKAMRSLALTALNDDEITTVSRLRPYRASHSLLPLPATQAQKGMTLAALCATLVLMVGGAIITLSPSSTEGWQSAWQDIKAANWREKIALAWHKATPKLTEP
jgi:anti-sigma factor RsiW